MARCPWCAEELPTEEAGARFCPFCGSDMTQTPPPSPDVPPEPAAIFTHSGNRFVLGHGPDFYGIWDRTNPAEAVRRFPRSDPGWDEAWRTFSSWEPAAAPVNPDGSLGRPVGPAYRPTETLSRWVTAFLVIGPLLGIAQIPYTLEQFRRVTDAVEGELTLQELNQVSGPGVAIGAIAGLVSLALIVLWLVWQHRSHANLRAMGVRGLRYTPGWAVGWWFIPVANIWMPYLTVRELWRASGPAASTDDWGGRPTGPVTAWWLTYIVPGVLIVPIGFYVGFRAETGGEILEFLRFFRLISIGGAVLQVIAGILAIVIVRRVTRNQALKRAAAEAGASADPREPGG